MGTSLASPPLNLPFFDALEGEKGSAAKGLGSRFFNTIDNMINGTPNKAIKKVAIAIQERAVTTPSQ